MVLKKVRPPIVNMPDVSGKGNGWLKVVVAGGIGDKNYTWTVETEGNAINDEDVANVVDTTTLKNRMEGEYHIHVEDMLGGCGIDTTLKVEYRPVGFDYVVNDVACQGTNSGSVTITGKGGYDKTQYEYMWVRLDADLAPIDTNYYHGRTIDIADLYAASYRCVVWQIDTSLVLPHDDTIVVKEPSNRLHIYNDSILVDGSNCYEAKGSISIMQPADSAAAYDYFGGYLPFTYYIDGEEITGSDIRKTNLKPDTYKVYIEDAKGCKFDTLVAVNDISAFKDSIYVSNVLRCNGDDNGEITVEVSSNNGNNFKFQWEKKTDDGALTLKDTTAVIGDLTAGTYMVKVTDDSLCVKFDTIKLSQPLPITFSVSNTIVNTCYTTNDGEIQIVSLKGGSEIPNLKYKAFKFENIAKEKTIYDNGKFVNALTVNTLVDTAFVLSEQLKPADYTVVTTVYSPSESDQGKSIKVYAMVSGSGVCAGKSAKDSATVIVNRVPNPKLTAPAAVCGDSARVKITDGIAGSVKSFTKASGAGNITFLNITDTTIDVKVSKAGEYKFNFTETNGDCSNQTPVTVTIRFDEKLKLKLTSLEDDTFMCSTGSNGEYQLKANAPGCDKTSISWSISSGLGEFDPKFGEIVSFKPTLLANDDKHEYKIMATGTPLASVCPAPYDSISIVVYRKPTPTFAVRSMSTSNSIRDSRC